MSTFCQRYTPHAFKKNICRDCFQSRQDHYGKIAVPKVSEINPDASVKEKSNFFAEQIKFTESQAKLQLRPAGPNKVSKKPPLPKRLPEAAMSIFAPSKSSFSANSTRGSNVVAATPASQKISASAECTTRPVSVRNLRDNLEKTKLDDSDNIGIESLKPSSSKKASAPTSSLHNSEATNNNPEEFSSLETTYPSQQQRIIARALHAYESTADTEELSFPENAEIEIIGDYDENWVRGSFEGRQGLVPISYLDPQDDNELPLTRETSVSGEEHAPLGTVVGLYDFEGKEVDELNFLANELLLLIKMSGEDWAYARSLSTGKEGLVPFSFVSFQ